VRALAQQGGGVRAVVRDPAKHAELSTLGAGVEVVTGDVTAVDSLRSALAGTSGRCGGACAGGWGRDMMMTL